MSQLKDLVQDRRNPYIIPQPHFIPGYTGHCPDLIHHIGHTYGWTTHAVLTEKPYAAERLSPLTPKCKCADVCVCPKDVSEEDEDPRLHDERDLDLVRKRKVAGQNLLHPDLLPGYTGHVPRTMTICGKRYTLGCVQGIAEFERMQKLMRDTERACSKNA